MLNKITSADVSRISCLIIGKSGIGKTSLIKTIVGQKFDNKNNKFIGEYNQENVYVLSAESGLLAIENLIHDNIITAYEINNISDLMEAYKLLSSTDFINNITKNGSNWIFIDSLTEIADLCETHLTEKYKDKQDNWGLWKDYANIMMNIIKKFRSLTQYNIVFSCLESIDKDQDNRRYASAEIGGNKLPKRLGALFDELFYMVSSPDDKGNNQIIFKTNPSQFHPAKDRSGKLNNIEEPNLLDIKNKIVQKNDDIKLIIDGEIYQEKQ